MEKILSKVKHIYLVGIGGIGMSGLAFLLKDKGYQVCGSDQKEGSNVAALRKEGVRVDLEHNAQNISDDIELVVYSSAVNDDNPELITARDKNIPVIKRGELLSYLCQDQKVVAVSGSHGKTTTTSLLSYLLTSLGMNPTVFVGGVPLNYHRHAWVGQEYFLIETDESDGSFLHYHPWTSIITNIDYEHMDHYQSVDKLHESFVQFSNQTKDLVIGCGDDPVVAEVIAKRKNITFGFGKNNTVRVQGITVDKGHTQFTLVINNEEIGRVTIPLLGDHNVLNVLAALAFFYSIDYDLNKVIGLLGEFKGTKRRFEIKNKIEGVTFIDDYAHHPTEIKAVLAAARSLDPGRVIALFQPHRYSRLKALWDEFIRCFDDADIVFVTDVYAASEEPIEGINSQILTKQIGQHTDARVCYADQDSLVSEAASTLADGDLVLSLGAGNINKIMEKIADEYQQRIRDKK